MLTPSNKDLEQEQTKDTKEIPQLVYAMPMVSTEVLRIFPCLLKWTLKSPLLLFVAFVTFCSMHSVQGWSRTVRTCERACIASRRPPAIRALTVGAECGRMAKASERQASHST
jgi:hypothetical protein